jgi:epoxyqueuosine reductase
MKNGLQHCGISKAEFEEDAPRLDKWFSNNYQGKMAYMANHSTSDRTRQSRWKALNQFARTIYYPGGCGDLTMQITIKSPNTSHGQDHHHVMC